MANLQRVMLPLDAVRDGAVDEAAFRKLVNWQIEQGTRGLFLWELRVNLRR